ncbi:MAG: helix-turn-helix transcriptional regulator [Vitreoscilla sp.]|nr:helix-turn-helix transcriptional regulator [Vitreoscilla sp.]
MEYGQILIDRAAQKGYSRYRLSQAVHVNQSHLSKIAGGGKISPVLAAKIAEVIGDDARLAALTAVAAQAESQEQDSLISAFGVEDWRKR